jgi:hypothetical protein
MAIAKNARVTVNNQPGKVFWVGQCKFSGQARIGVRFDNGESRFVLAAYAVEVKVQPAADPRRRNGFLHVNDMTPAEREAHEECMANMPIRAMVREMVRGWGEDAAEGDYLASQFEDLLDREER